MNSFKRRNNREKRKWISIFQLYLTANFVQVKTEIYPPNGSFHDSVAVDDDLCFCVVTHQCAGLFWTAIFPAVLVGIRNVIVLILWFSDGVREALFFAGVGNKANNKSRFRKLITEFSCRDRLRAITLANIFQRLQDVPIFRASWKRSDAV